MSHGPADEGERIVDSSIRTTPQGSTPSRPDNSGSCTERYQCEKDDMVNNSVERPAHSPESEPVRDHRQSDKSHDDAHGDCDWML